MPDKAKSRTSHIKGRRGNAEEETRLHPNRITWRDDYSGITFINTYKDVANSAEDGCGTLWPWDLGSFLCCFIFSSRIAVKIGVTFTSGLLVGIGNIFASALGLLWLLQRHLVPGHCGLLCRDDSSRKKDQLLDGQVFWEAFWIDAMVISKLLLWSCHG